MFSKPSIVFKSSSTLELFFLKLSITIFASNLLSFLKFPCNFALRAEASELAGSKIGVSFHVSLTFFPAYNFVAWGKDLTSSPVNLFHLFLNVFFLKLLIDVLESFITFMVISSSIVAFSKSLNSLKFG